MTKKKAHGHFCKGDKAEQKGLGRSSKGWDGCEVDLSNMLVWQTSFAYNGCGWSFVSRLFACICIKLIPSQLRLRLFQMQEISQQNEPGPPNKANMGTDACWEKV